MINSGDWPTPIPDRLLDQCAEVAQYNIASKHEDEMIEQKNLYIKMMEEPTEYSATNFALGLSHSSLTHNGVTPLCMRYLREASKKKVTADSGIWRLWPPPKDVERAETLYKGASSVDPEENKRLQHNLNSPLDERKEGKPDPVDETLDSHIQRAKGDGKGDKDFKERTSERTW